MNKLIELITQPDFYFSQPKQASFNDFVIDTDEDRTQIYQSNGVGRTILIERSKQGFLQATKEIARLIIKKQLDKDKPIADYQSPEQYRILVDVLKANRLKLTELQKAGKLDKLPKQEINVVENGFL